MSTSPIPSIHFSKQRSILDDKSALLYLFDDLYNSKTKKYAYWLTSEDQKKLKSLEFPPNSDQYRFFRVTKDFSRLINPNNSEAREGFQLVKKYFKVVSKKDKNSKSNRAGVVCYHPKLLANMNTNSMELNNSGEHNNLLMNSNESLSQTDLDAFVNEIMGQWVSTDSSPFMDVMPESPNMPPQTRAISPNHSPTINIITPTIKIQPSDDEQVHDYSSPNYHPQTIYPPIILNSAPTVTVPPLAMPAPQHPYYNFNPGSPSMDRLSPRSPSPQPGSSPTGYSYHIGGSESPGEGSPRSVPISINSNNNTLTPSLSRSPKRKSGEYPSMDFPKMFPGLDGLPFSRQDATSSLIRILQLYHGHDLYMVALFQQLAASPTFRNLFAKGYIWLVDEDEAIALLSTEPRDCGLLRLSSKAVDKLVLQLGESKYFATVCETLLEDIVFNGVHKLLVMDANGQVMCQDITTFSTAYKKLRQ